MENIISKIKELYHQNPKTFKILTPIFVSLFLIKYYFNGTYCKKNRPILNQVIVITGSNTGIGFQTAKQLAKRKATLLLCCRSKKRGEQAIKKIQNYYPQAQIYFFELDLANIHSIESCVSQIKKKFPYVNILINNAGIIASNQRQTTKDGFQISLGVNHLGHFYLTHLMMPLLMKKQNSRIINVSSRAHASSIFMKKIQIDKDDINYTKKYNALIAYSKSKLANILFTNKLKRLFQQKNIKIKVVSLHPGVVRTQLNKNILEGNYFKKLFLYSIYPIFFFVTKSSYQGAQTTLYCVLEDYSTLVNGGYYVDCKLGQTSSQAKNIQTQDYLWNKSQQLLNIKFNI